MKPRGQIFICYRREGGSEMARLVHESLRQRGFKVFMDVEELKSGQFNESLLLEIEAATDVIVILTPASLDRCFQEGDWLRWEVGHAIACEKNVVPVMVRGFAWPSQPLPDDLKRLPYYQGVEPSHDLFEASIDKLVRLLKARPALWASRPKQIPLAVSLLAIMAIFVAWLLFRQGEESSIPGKPAPEKPDTKGWVRLFDGNSLNGWTAPDIGDWTIKDGVLVAHMRSHLFSPYTYTNLEVKSEVMLSHHGNSGIYIRAQLGKGFPKGYRAQINNTATDKHRTGSLKAAGGKSGVLNAVTQQLIADDAWFTMHIIAVSNHFIIKVNDKIVTDCLDPKNTYSSGYLALEQINGDTVVMFRNTMVKRLPDDEKEAWAIAKKDVPDISP